MQTLRNNSILIPRAHTNMISRSFLYRGAVVPLYQRVSEVLIVEHLRYTQGLILAELN